MNLFYLPEPGQGVQQLPAEESHHAIKVMRLRPGDTIDLTDGKGHHYKGVITHSDTRSCEFKTVEKIAVPGKPYSVHVGFAPTKNMDRTEWFVEKAVELGVDKISFLKCQHSERKTIQLERLKKVAVSALKQSQQYWMPQLSGMIPFDAILQAEADQKFIAYVDESNPAHLKSLARPGDRYLVLIGPEGDFSKQEIELALKQDFQKVSLGKNRLRSETAALMVCQVLSLLHVE